MRSIRLLRRVCFFGGSLIAKFETCSKLKLFCWLDEWIPCWLEGWFDNWLDSWLENWLGLLDGWLDGRLGARWSLSGDPLRLEIGIDGGPKFATGPTYEIVRWPRPFIIGLRPRGDGLESFDGLRLGGSLSESCRCQLDSLDSLSFSPSSSSTAPIVLEDFENGESSSRWSKEQFSASSRSIVGLGTSTEFRGVTNGDSALVSVMVGLTGNTVASGSSGDCGGDSFFRSTLRRNRFTKERRFRRFSASNFGEFFVLLGTLIDALRTAPVALLELLAGTDFEWIGVAFGESEFVDSCPGSPSARRGLDGCGDEGMTNCTDAGLGDSSGRKVGVIGMFM